MCVCVFTFCFWPVWLNKLATQSRLIAYLKCRLCYKTGAHFAHTGAEQSGIKGERGREGGGKVVVLAGVPGYLLGCCACGSVCLTCVSRCRPSSSNCIRCQRIATPPRQQQRQHATMMAATATVVAAARVDILKLTLQLEQRLIKKSK